MENDTAAPHHFFDVMTQHDTGSPRAFYGAMPPHGVDNTSPPLPTAAFVTNYSPILPWQWEIAADSTPLSILEFVLVALTGYFRGQWEDENASPLKGRLFCWVQRKAQSTKRCIKNRRTIPWPASPYREELSVSTGDSGVSNIIISQRRRLGVVALCRRKYRAIQGSGVMIKLL